MIDYTVDLLIFGISSKENNNIRELSKKDLSVILVKRDKEPFKDQLVLPGGYVNKNETSLEAAKRVLEKETGLTNIELYFSNVNDEVKRDPRNRTISASYIALVDVNKIDKKLKKDSSWYDIDYYVNDDRIDIKLSNIEDNLILSVGRKIIDKKCNYEKYFSINKNTLGFDHDVILTTGIMDLRNKVKNTDIIFNPLPEYFTIGSLEQIYGNILKEKVVNSAFRRVFAEKLEISDKMVKTGGHRPSYLYRYKELKNKVINEEMVDIYNSQTMEKTGESISKKSAHKLGIWHSCVHLLIINKDKTKTLFQQRAENKDLYPNKWDVAVGGHILEDEEAIDAVKRELKEELGLTPSKYNIKFLKKYKEKLNNKDIDSKEIIFLFILYSDIESEKIKLQKEEVKDIKWINKEEMELLIQNKTVIPHIEEYNLLREILR